MVIFVIYAAVVWSAAYFMRRTTAGLVVALLSPIPVALAAWGVYHWLLAGHDMPVHMIVVVPTAYGVVIMAGAWLFATQRRLPRAACRRCTYDLAGNLSGVCPECGQPIGARDALETPDAEAIFAAGARVGTNYSTAAARRARASTKDSVSTSATPATATSATSGQ